MNSMKTEPTEACKMIEESWYAIPYMGADYPQDPDIVIDKEDVYEIAKKAFQEGQSNPKIKQLEWLDDNFPYRGCSVFVDYIISNKIGSRYTVILDIGTGIYINSFKTIDEAKAAAQADFEQRIKECLE